MYISNVCLPQWRHACRRSAWWGVARNWRWFPSVFPRSMWRQTNRTRHVSRMVTPATTGRVTARHDLISSGSLQPQQLQIKLNIGTKLLLLWQVAHEAERSVTSSEHHSSVTRSELHASSCVCVGRKEFKQPSSCERIKDPRVLWKTKFSLRHPWNVCSVHVVVLGTSLVNSRSLKTWVLTSPTFKSILIVVTVTVATREFAVLKPWVTSTCNRL